MDTYIEVTSKEHDRDRRVAQDLVLIRVLASRERVGERSTEVGVGTVDGRLDPAGVAEVGREHGLRAVHTWHGVIRG